MKKIIQNDIWSLSSFLENNNYNFNKKNILTNLPEKFIDEAINSISSWDTYSPTPLIKLNKLNNLDSKIGDKGVMTLVRVR